MKSRVALHEVLIAIAIALGHVEANVKSFKKTKQKHKTKNLKKIQLNRKKSNFFIFFKKYSKKVIKSTNQIKILFLWVDGDGPPYCRNIVAHNVAWVSKPEGIKTPFASKTQTLHLQQTKEFERLMSLLVGVVNNVLNVSFITPPEDDVRLTSKFVKSFSL